VAPNVNFWIGKRFYGRADVHILDTKFVRMDGPGFGADNIALSGAKLAVAYFRQDAGSGAPPGTEPSGEFGQRFNIDIAEFFAGDGGKLRLTTTFTHGHADNITGAGGTSGVGISVQHDLRLDSIGATNTVRLQHALGSAGLDGNFGVMTAKPGVGQWRLVESVSWQQGAVGGQAVALYGRHDHDDVNAVAAYAEVSVGGRVSYALTGNVKLIAETGYMEKRPKRSDTQRLVKFTFSPTWSAGPELFDRPEIRIFVTIARWNDAANAAAGAGGLTGLANGQTRGVSWGAQFETWF
jgi:maltoporin